MSGQQPSRNDADQRFGAATLMQASGKRLALV